MPKVPEIKAWLKAHGHKPNEVNKLEWTTLADKRQSLCSLHGVSPQEYRAVSH